MVVGWGKSVLRRAHASEKQRATRTESVRFAKTALENQGPITCDVTWASSRKITCVNASTFKKMEKMTRRWVRKKFEQVSNSILFFARKMARSGLNC